MQAKTAINELIIKPCQYFLRSGALSKSQKFALKQRHLTEHGLTPVFYNSPWSIYHDELIGSYENVYQYGAGGSSDPEHLKIGTGREQMPDEIHITPSSSLLQSWPYCFLNPMALEAQWKIDKDIANSIIKFVAKFGQTLTINGEDVTTDSELINFINQMIVTLPDLSRVKAWGAIVQAINTGETDLNIFYADEGVPFYALKSWEGIIGQEIAVEFVITVDELKSMAMNRNARVALKLLNQFGTHTEVWEMTTTKKTLFVSNLTRPIAVQKQSEGQSAFNQKYDNVNTRQYITVDADNYKMKQEKTENYDCYCLSCNYFDLTKSKYRDIF